MVNITEIRSGNFTACKLGLLGFYSYYLDTPSAVVNGLTLNNITVDKKKS